MAWLCVVRESLGEKELSVTLLWNVSLLGKKRIDEAQRFHSFCLFFGCLDTNGGSNFFDPPANGSGLTFSFRWRDA